MKHHSLLRRLLSVLLCLTMVFSLFPVSVFAEGVEEPAAQPEQSDKDSFDLKIDFVSEDGAALAEAYELSVAKGAAFEETVPFAAVEGFRPAKVEFGAVDAANAPGEEGVISVYGECANVLVTGEGMVLSGAAEADIHVIVTYVKLAAAVEEQPAETEQPVEAEEPAINSVPRKAARPSDEPLATYRFGDVELKAANGRTVTVPVAPTVGNEVFVCWRTDNGVEVQPGDVLTAVFEGEAPTYVYTAVYSALVTVTFESADGTVYGTAVAQLGEDGRYYASQADIDAASEKFDQDIEANKKLNGWTMKDSGAAFTADTAFDASITVVAAVVEGQFVQFNSMGGTSVPRAEINNNGKITSPDAPTRTGYNFTGWYTDEACTNAYDFNVAATPNATLYAKWDGQPVSYTVIYWAENANWDNQYLPEADRDVERYSYIASEIQTGKAGTEVSLSNLNKNKPAPAEGFADGKLATGESKLISGEGTSIFNVYYDRNEFTVTYKDAGETGTLTCGMAEHSHNSSCDLNCGKEEHTHSSTCCSKTGLHIHLGFNCSYDKCGMAEHTHNDGCYGCGKAAHTHSSSCYTKDKVVTAKYGANISATWPGGNWYVSSTGKWQANIQTMPINGQTFSNGQTSGSSSAPQANYYLEALPEDTSRTTEVINGKTFYKDHADIAYGTSNPTISAEDTYAIPGFTYWGVYQNGFHAGATTGYSYNNAKFCYTRNQYDVAYQIIGGDKTTDNYLYDQQISARAVPDGYDGWFLDEICTKPADAVLAGKMPDTNIVVYARKHVDNYQVTVHVSVVAGGSEIGTYTAGQIITKERLEADAKANNVELPAADIFRGWFVKNEDGSFTAYDFSNPLTGNIELYALSKTDLGTVTYQDAEGNDLGLDSAKYVLGAKATAKVPEGISGFDHWNIIGDGTVKPGQTFTVSGNIVLRAALSDNAPVQVVLNFDANEGAFSAGVAESVTGSEYSRVTLPTADDVERDGYILIGWAKDRNAEQPSFEPGEEVMLVSGDPDTLYAVWKSNRAAYEIKHGFENIFDGYTEGYYDDWITAYTGSGIIGSTVTIDEPPAYEHYVLNREKTSFSGVINADGTECIDVYYDRVPYTVSYEVDGKVVASEQHKWGKTVSVESEPSKPGYDFTGWIYGDISVSSGEFEMPKHDVVITGHYTARSDTPYTVEYYVENLAGDAYELYRAENKDGITDEEVTATTIEIPGFTFDAENDNNILTGIIAGDGSLTLKLYYDRIDSLSYTVKYLEQGTNKELATAKTVDNQTFGAKVTETAIDIDGYNKVDPASMAITIAVEGNEITFYYTRRTDLSYTVNYYEKDTNNKVADSRTVSGQTFGTEITAAGEKINITGYSYDSADKETLTVGTGENVINLYYTISSYKVIYKYIGEVPAGAAELPAEATYNYNAEVTVADKPADIEGYTFTGWSKQGSFNMPAEDVTITGYYTAKNDTAYTVEYYVENLAGDGYELKETVNNAGTTGIEVTAEEKSFAGFTLNKNIDGTKATGVIAGDGSLTLKLYYTRNSYTVNYVLDGKPYDEVVAPKEYKYGETVTLADAPEFDKDVVGFSGWHTDAAVIDGNGFTMPANAVTLVGTLEVLPTADYVVEHYRQNVDKTGYELFETEPTYTVHYYDGKTVTATPKSYDGFRFNGEAEGSVLEAALDKENPVTLKLYYDRVDGLSYTVKYLEKDTNAVLHAAKTVDNQVFGAEITEQPVAIPGYTAPEAQIITIAETGNEIIFYYTRRTDLGYTVNYLEQDTKAVLSQAKIITGQIFGDSVTEKAIDIVGYNKVDPAEQTFTIEAENNVINFFYTKRTDLSYTVNYLEQATNKVLADSKTVSGQTFGDSVTEEAIDIIGYNKADPTSVAVEITAGTNEANFYYVKDESARHSVSVRVDYYKDGVFAESDEIVSSESWIGEAASVTATPNESNKFVGYKYDRTEGALSYTVEAKAATGDVNVVEVYYTINSYKVSYEYTGMVPAGATALPEAADHSYNSEVSIAPDASAYGYTFSGWTASNAAVNDGKFTMPAGDVTFTGSFEPVSGIKYTVKYVDEKGNPVGRGTMTLFNGVYGETVIQRDPGVTGYKLADTCPAEQSIVIDLDPNNNVITFVYTRQSYKLTVNYVYAEDGSEAATTVEQTVLYDNPYEVVSPVITGYTADKEVVSSKWMPSHDVTVTVKYSVNSYKVSYEYTGTVPAGATALPEAADHNYNSEVSVAPDASAYGYTFSGWTASNAAVNDGKFTMPAGDVTFTGSFEPVSGIKYTVKYVDEKGNPVGRGTMTLFNGVYGETVIQRDPGVTGYKLADTCPAEQSIVIDLDPDNNVITFVYTRQSYKLTVNYVYDKDGSEAATTVEQTVPYRTPYEVVSPIIPGYTADQSVISGKRMPSRDISFTVRYFANEGTAYTVNHYQETLEGGYELAETDNMAGITDEQTNAQAKVYDGFTAQPFNQATIKGDGTTAIDIYYTRNTYTVSYEYEGNVPTGASALPAAAQFKYGAAVEVAAPAAAAGYTFSGWNSGNFEMPAEDVVITGSFSVRTDLSYTVNYLAAGTNTPLADPTTVPGQTFGATVTVNPITIAGYITPVAQTIVIDVENNVVNFYYPVMPFIDDLPAFDIPPIPPLPENIDDEITPLVGPEVTVDDPVNIDDEATPLAGGEHQCCILHFLILCAALLIELLYISDKKKRQQKIFEMRRELNK